jgi:hypothetical protein
MMRLRNRPWKLLLLTAFATVLLVVGGVDILDGVVVLRRYGQISSHTNSGMFALYVAGYCLMCVLVGVCWIILKSEWSLDYRSPLKPRFHDPERTRRF